MSPMYSRSLRARGVNLTAVYKDDANIFRTTTATAASTALPRPAVHECIIQKDGQAVAALVAAEADPGHHRRQPYYKRPSYYNQRRPHGAVHSGGLGSHATHGLASVSHSAGHLQGATHGVLGGHATLGHASVGLSKGATHGVHGGHASVSHLKGSTHGVHGGHATLGHASVSHLKGSTHGVHGAHATLGHASVSHSKGVTHSVHGGHGKKYYH
ncbi:hypothetical protein O3P69_002491 [Scylla paramamosain]|uniref:Uncharacterized protein n=1 Tax=Scylla paramamosain TaxID=85552 RepID=A0AAW0UKS1_SCYPA